MAQKGYKWLNGIENPGAFFMTHTGWINDIESKGFFKRPCDLEQTG